MNSFQLIMLGGLNILKQFVKLLVLPWMLQFQHQSQAALFSFAALLLAFQENVFPLTLQIKQEVQPFLPLL